MTTTTATKPKRTTKRTSVPKSEPAAMSKTAAAAILGEDHTPDWGRILHLDPRTLTLDENVRKDIGMTAEFAADVAAHGVLVPLSAHRDAVGQLLVHDGQRRLVAAIEADNEVNSTVPVYVTPAFGDNEERISTQDRINHHRTGLTVKDQVGVYEQLSLMGRSAESIAKKLKRPVTEVESALAVAKSKAAVTTAEQAPSLTLDQLAAIAEFDDNPEIQKDLRETAIAYPLNFAHSLQRHRDDRARTQVKAAAVAELEAAGVPVIDESWWSARGGDELENLKDKPGGKKLTPKAHSSCPGHAAYVAMYANSGGSGSGYRAHVVYGCTAWVKHGHDHKYKDAKSAASNADLSPEQLEAAKAERRAVRENNKASESSTLVRRRFVIDLLQRKTLPDDAPQAAAEILSRKRDADYGSRDVIAVLLGTKTVPSADQLGRSKRDALAYLLADAFARIEVGMVDNDKDWWRSQDATRIAYLKRLKSWGYGLSPLEAAYVSNKVEALVL